MIGSGDVSGHDLIKPPACLHWWRQVVSGGIGHASAALVPLVIEHTRDLDGPQRKDIKDTA